MAEFKLKQTAEEVQKAVDNALLFGDTEVVILEEQELVYDAEAGGSVAPILVPVEAGSIVFVVFDGVRYECVANSMPPYVIFGNLGIVGEEDTGEPFLCMCAGNEAIVVFMDESNHTVKISAMTAVKIPERYLPSLKFYFDQAKDYLYTDKECTIKATIADIPDNADFDIGYAASAGLVSMWYRPIQSGSKLFAESKGFGYVLLMRGTEFIELHTAEYTPTT
jgi:hypothetical protein